MARTAKPKVECIRDGFTTIMVRTGATGPHPGWEQIAGTPAGDRMAERAVARNKRLGLNPFDDLPVSELKQLAKELAAETGEEYAVFTRRALCRRKR